MEIKIYVASVNAWAAKWITLNNKTYEEVMDEIQEMLKNSPDPNTEEWEIHNTEAPFIIEDVDDLESVMKIVNEYDACDAEEDAKDAAAEIFDVNYLEIIYASFYAFYKGEYFSLEDYAAELVYKKSGKIDEMFLLANYIDYERLARDMSFEGYKEHRGYIFYTG